MVAPEKKDKIQVLVVDDEKTVCQSVEKILGRIGHKVEHALTVTSALGAIEGKGNNRFDLVIADLMMPQVGGMELLREVKSRWPEISVLIITGYGSIESAVEATKLGASGYLPKPFTPEELAKAVEAATSLPPITETSQRNTVSKPESLPPSGSIDVDMPFDAQEVAKATSPKYVERLTRSDVATVATDYCHLGKRTCKRFVSKGMCKGEECPIEAAERKRAGRASEFIAVKDPIDVDMPFSASEVAALTSDAYVASLGRSDMPVVGRWPSQEDLAKRVLVVDDEPVVVNSIRKTLSRKGLGVDYANTAEEGLAKVLSGEYDLVLLDMKLPDMGGLELLGKIKRRAPDLPVVMVTGFASIDTAVEAIRSGANDYVAKPFTPDELYSLTGKYLKKVA